MFAVLSFVCVLYCAVHVCVCARACLYARACLCLCLCLRYTVLHCDVLRCARIFVVALNTILFAYILHFNARLHGSRYSDGTNRWISWYVLSHGLAGLARGFIEGGGGLDLVPQYPRAKPYGCSGVACLRTIECCCMFAC